MEQYKIDRINELAHRVRSGGTLTEEELAEREALRREYIDSVKRALTDQLDNTYLVDGQGRRRKLPRKK